MNEQAKTIGYAKTTDYGKVDTVDAIMAVMPEKMFFMPEGRLHSGEVFAYNEDTRTVRKITPDVIMNDVDTSKIRYKLKYSEIDDIIKTAALYGEKNRYVAVPGNKAIFDGENVFVPPAIKSILYTNKSNIKYYFANVIPKLGDTKTSEIMSMLKVAVTNFVETVNDECSADVTKEDVCERFFFIINTIYRDYVVNDITNVTPPDQYFETTSEIISMIHGQSSAKNVINVFLNEYKDLEIDDDYDIFDGIDDGEDDDDDDDRGYDMFEER